MSFGFLINDANGNPVLNTDSITVLSVDDIYLSAGGSVTRSYADTPPNNANVISLGSSLINSGATVNKYAAGDGVTIVIYASRDGWFRIILD